jgi:hypothetical protein
VNAAASHVLDPAITPIGVAGQLRVHQRNVASVPVIVDGVLPIAVHLGAEISVMLPPARQKVVEPLFQRTQPAFEIWRAFIHADKNEAMPGRQPESKQAIRSRVEIILAVEALGLGQGAAPAARCTGRGTSAPAG